MLKMFMIPPPPPTYDVASPGGDLFVFVLASLACAGFV